MYKRQGGSDYLTSRLTDRLWYQAYGSNSNSQQEIPIGTANGHAPNLGSTLDHQTYSNNPMRMQLRHRYGSDSYYGGTQTFEIQFASARTGLDGTNAKRIHIYAYIG